MFDIETVWTTLATALPESGLIWGTLTLVNLYLFKLILGPRNKAEEVVVSTVNSATKRKSTGDPVFDNLMYRIEESHPDNWIPMDSGWFRSTVVSGLTFAPLLKTAKEERAKNGDYFVAQDKTIINDLLTKKQQKQLGKALDDLLARKRALAEERRREAVTNRLKPLEAELEPDTSHPTTSAPAQKPTGTPDTHASRMYKALLNGSPIRTWPN